MVHKIDNQLLRAHQAGSNVEGGGRGLDCSNLGPYAMLWLRFERPAPPTDGDIGSTTFSSSCWTRSTPGAVVFAGPTDDARCSVEECCKTLVSARITATNKFFQSKSLFTFTAQHPSQCRHPLHCSRSGKSGIESDCLRLWHFNTE